MDEDKYYLDSGKEMTGEELVKMYRFNLTNELLPVAGYFCPTCHHETTGMPGYVCPVCNKGLVWK